MLSAGTYKAKIVGCFTGQSGEKKTPYYGIEFEVENESIDYIAYLTDATKEKALTTLIKVGLKDGLRISDLSNPSLKVSDIFNEIDDDIKIVVEMEDYQNKNGETKQKPVVKWVNVGSIGGVTKFDAPTAVKFFNSLPFDADLSKIRRKTPEPKAKETKNDFAHDEVPF